MSKTNPARGMRDFLPVDVRKREYVIGIIKQVYESYGYEPLETPAVENIETLMGKYGEEGNQLVFKILKRGEKLSESLQSSRVIELQSSENSGTAETPATSADSLSDLALRYDLTVPLARVVADRKNELPKFFKRYQIQPVWRADRPARGRFREFYQCDVDAIGSKSMVVEAEVISAVSEILTRLGFKNFVVRVNHREILMGMLETAYVERDRKTAAITAIDKLDKIGADGVLKELLDSGISQASSKTVTNFLREMELINRDDTLEVAEASNRIQAALSEWSRQSSGQPIYKGQDELAELFRYASAAGAKGLKFDPTLARGLSYYTGTIMEINVPDLAGSLGGGGRYDGLIGMFGKEQIPACGFSLGLERILVVMDERGMFPPEIAESRAGDVMVTIWNEESIAESLKLADELRKQNLRVLVYPEADKLGKQIKYADSIKVPFVCVLGESELAENKVTLKNMETGEQETLERTQIENRIKTSKL